MTTQGGAARSFVDRIFETIRRCPDVVAVQDPQRALTYRQLDELSTALAASIQERVETFDPVVVDVPRSVDLVVAIFAVLRSGRGCVPVDRTQPARRTEAILANASARYEVRDVQPTGRRSRGQLDVVPLPPIDRPSADSRPPDVMEQLAYVLYTSGSTGEPKGVAMGCTPLSELMSWHAHTEGGSVPTRTAQFAPITFDVAWQEVLSSLVLGSTLLIIPDEVRRDPVRLLEHLSTTGVTRLFLPTAYLQTLADRGRRYAALPRLEHVFVAGSQLRITHEIRQWFAQLGGCRLHNHYGPTETHVVTSYTLGQDVSQWPDLPPIGRPLPHVSVRVVDADGADVPVGGTGELLLGGRCLANGYRNDSALTAERFVKAGGERWYRTGDLVEWRDDELWFLGRADRQVKIDGHRVEPAEVEVVLARHPDVSDAHVGVSVDGRGRPRLVAYVVSRTGMEEDLPVGRVAVPPWGDLIADVLPTYCVPSIWVRVDEIPLNAHGKVDLARLPDVKRDRPALAATYSPPRTRLERVIARVWEERLDVVGIGRDDNFFDLGGSSLLAAAMVGDVCAALGVELTLVEAYAHPTVRALAEHVDTRDTGVKANTRREHRRERTDAEQPIAVVGIACRFPGADSPAAYWSNLMSGTESITRRSAVRDEHGKTYAAGVLPDVDLFDAAYFGLSAAQARLLDPQHRLFLECCVEALEDAACVPRPETPIGLYAGSGPSTYMLNNLLSSRDARTLTGSVEDFNILMANDKEFLAGRASYALDLRGPSVNVNAACATSLYAVHYAAQALRFRDCDIALAGAAYIQVPQLFGYTYEESMPFSPDGHCRAFDRDAAGTVFGSGVGVVVLKPLAVALADGDDIYAVLRGTGISNDGAQKVGMTAPSVAGQERAIQMALEAGQVAPSSIRYVEAHGTATPVGDAIEIEALRRAYGPLPVASCGIGSVKNNVGHLGWASGMAGLIKAVLILRHQQVPPTPNYREPNPDLNLGSSPFVVDDRLRDLPTNGEPISVAVSAFGIGGFNAHAILEQAPEPVSQVEEPRRWYVLPFSARSDDACERLVDSFRDEPLAAVPVPDVARTLGTGRRHHERRRAAVAAADESLAAPLGRLGTQRPTTTYAAGQMVVGLFAGHGVERRGTGRELYETEPVFRSVLDSFDSLTKAELGATVASLLYAPERQDVPIRDVVEVHAITFAVQLALFRLMESKGMRFDVVLGHSMGQYVAACAAGVFTAEDGMYVAIERGRAIEGTTADGTMAIVPADAATVRRLIGQTGVALDIAVVNSDRNTVVSGLTVDVERFAAAVRSAGVDVQPLGSLRAGHSRWMRPAADRLVRAFGQVRLSPPERMLICNTTGVVAADEVATPAYWARHLCEPVQFAAGLRRARDLGAGMFVELSGSAGMLSLASAVLDGHAGPWIPVLRPQQDAARSLANALAAAYEAGLDLDWAAVNGGYGRPTHLPTYPFQRRQYWTGPPAIWSGDASSPNDGSVAGAPIHEVRWRHIDLPDGSSLDRRFVVVGPDGPWRIQVSALLAGAAHTADPRDDAVRAADDVVVLFDDGDLDAGTDPVEALRPSITRLLDLVQGVVAAGAGSPPRLWLVTCGGQHTRPVDIVVPLQRALWGMGRVIALEHPELRVGLVDLPATATLADLDVLRSCLAASVPDRELAVRQGAAVSARLVPAEAGERTHVELRPDHTYLVIGGLTGVGLWTTQVLVEAGARHLLLIGRRPPGPIAEQRIAALREAGVSVEVASVDVGDAAAVDRLFAERRAEGPPIGGVVHSAGVLNDCLVGNADWSRVAPVLEAKVRGSWNLHQAAMRHDAPLSFFALYSSASAVHGNYGQAAYAAANAFLDGLAWLRSAQGLPGVSFNWGVFEGVGHVSTDTELMATLQQRGLGTVDAGVAKAVLLDHLSAATPEVMVLPNDWEAFLDVHNLRDASFYAELSAGTPGNPGPRKAASVRARLCAASAHERPDLLSRHIIGMINQYVELPTPISVDDRIADLGLDSLSTIQLRNDLQRALRTPLPARLLVTFPTVADLATHLLSSVLDLSAVTTEAVAIDGTVTETPPASAVEVVLSLEQRRWLRLIRRVGYGQRIVPVIFHDRLDRTAFRVALHTVLGRHDLLRQSYPNADSIVVLPVDEVMPADDDLFRDLSGTSTEVCAEAVASELGRLRAEIPDPVERPSWSVRCLALPADQFMLIVAGQHLEFDGSGLSVFVDEVRQVYREVRDTGAAPKLDPAFQYAEYARSQATYLAQGIDQARAHLTGIFTGVPRPTRLRRADDGDTTTAHPSVRYTPREPLAYWNEVRETAERLTVTPFAVILGSYAMLVNELVDAPTVCVSVIRSSRFDQRYASTIGPFTMPFPVPVHVQGWEGLELVRQVDDTLAALSLYPQYPATDLLTATRAFAGLPMDTYFSDVGINFTNYRRDEQVGSPRVDLVEVLGEVTHPLLRQYDFGALRRIPGLHLVVAVEGRELVGNYWYHAHRFTEMQVADWARRHRGLLSDLLAKASGWERSDAPIN